MSTPNRDEPSAAELEAGVLAALEAQDIPAVVALVKALVAVDPRRGAAIYDTIQAGLKIAQARQ